MFDIESRVSSLLVLIAAGGATLCEYGDFWSQVWNIKTGL